MISCPNCNHQNPDGAVQCEACYTPLPLSTACPQCGASVQENATFCGQCGFNLKANTAPAAVPSTVVPTSSSSPELGFEEEPTAALNSSTGEASISPSAEPTVAMAKPTTASSPMATTIQTQSVQLLHVQTDVPLNVPNSLTVIHIGKPNDVVPPDIDVSGFPNSEVVSRVHADLRLEEGLYYIEDTGSSNGTYINHVPLAVGNRHRLRSGDRIALGKGDKVTFIFQTAQL
ncbi:MAG: FHA domain-containing protein [Limnothrix sp. RL_2_0]|nr:FHA domain-containing protein [Limnothrix sp. RL_2_0]